MTSGIINIALGGVGIYMGLKGGVLVFTHSSEALVVAGGAFIAFGIYQIWRDKRRPR